MIDVAEMLYSAGVLFPKPPDPSPANADGPRRSSPTVCDHRHNRRSDSAVSAIAASPTNQEANLDLPTAGTWPPLPPECEDFACVLIRNNSLKSLPFAEATGNLAAKQEGRRQMTVENWRNLQNEAIPRLYGVSWQVQSTSRKIFFSDSQSGAFTAD